jgi:hypothetical protein
MGGVAQSALHRQFEERRCHGHAVYMCAADLANVANMNAETHNRNTPELAGRPAAAIL